METRILLNPIHVQHRVSEGLNSVETIEKLLISSARNSVSEGLNSVETSIDSLASPARLLRFRRT